MATYKVPQDVEAEDKFVGPLTFKQFLFAGGAGIAGYLIFIFATREIWVLVGVMFPFFAVCAILAIPWSKDQPTELWLAARIRFFLVPRKRIWDQSGLKDLVQITVPKREVHIYTDGLTQDQVRTRLNALASVVDTRGWAVKNATGNADSDRLVQNDTSVPTEAEAIINSATDIMDEASSPIAQQFNTMIQASEQKHRQETLQLLDRARQANQNNQGNDTSSDTPKDFWFLREQPAPADPSLASFKASPLVQPGSPTSTAPQLTTTQAISADDEEQLLQQVHQRQQQEQAVKQTSHLKTILPLSQQPQTPPPSTSAGQVSASTTPVDPAILALADNDDLTVETIARQAKRDMPDEGEVVISLR